jgi:hypothetical protein
MVFIERELVPEPAVQAVIGIGSIVSGLARPDSDIDAIIFLDPFDWYIVPAEFKWCPSDNSFHSIFSQVPGPEECMQFDFAVSISPSGPIHLLSGLRSAVQNCTRGGWPLIGPGKLLS